MRRCSKCNIQFEDTRNFCPNCGSPLEIMPDHFMPKQPEKKKSVVVPILLALSIIVNIGLGVLAFTIYDEKEYYSDQYYDAKLDYDEIEGTYSFYDGYARVVRDDDSGLYHRYGCERLDADGEL